jgi:hypothetical protein
LLPIRNLYTVKKKVRELPVPSWDVTTKLSLGGNNDVVTELFLPRGSLVSDIQGKLVNLFYGVHTAIIAASEPLHSLLLPPIAANAMTKQDEFTLIRYFHSLKVRPKSNYNTVKIPMHDKKILGYKLRFSSLIQIELIKNHRAAQKVPYRTYFLYKLILSCIRGMAFYYHFAPWREYDSVIIHRKKRFASFPSPAGNFSLLNSPWAGIMTS